MLPIHFKIITFRNAKHDYGTSKQCLNILVINRTSAYENHSFPSISKLLHSEMQNMITSKQCPNILVINRSSAYENHWLITNRVFIVQQCQIGCVTFSETVTFRNFLEHSENSSTKIIPK